MLKKADSLYIHVPFCVRKCKYCDFYSVSVDDELVGRYVEALERELQLYTGMLSRPLATIYVGGGTPTSLSMPHLRRLLGNLKKFVGPGTEYTIEANPGTLDNEKIGLCRFMNINRVSLGAQSFHDDELAGIGRIHTRREIFDSFKMLRDAGFDNINLDLIFALPGQSLKKWRESLRQAVRLSPEHISCYALSYENGTEFHTQLSNGELQEIEDEEQLRMYNTAIYTLINAGFEHYEISNFARPGLRCRHNLVYWFNYPYIGIGPSAASSFIHDSFTTRRTNIRDVRRWISAMLDDSIPSPGETETLNMNMTMAETLMLRLRMREGMRLTNFGYRFGMSFEDAFPYSISTHLASGGLAMNGEKLMIPRERLFVANTVLADIVHEAAEKK
ncbi:MAG TPA: radical SAM family heme chaperone HemW [Phycisphaerae bacterium]|nr:radical SAM family heme chaperone HemW [Phycisphaerae bacterium]HPS52805.1 radical SAM family heme chaperone HemW [Phycisphaerae bacterium]